MPIETLQKIVESALADVKAKDVVCLNTTELTPLFSRMIIATGDSSRHVRALADRVATEVKLAGGTVLATEGEETGEWVIVDLFDIVVHVMLSSTRTTYNLEELWDVNNERAPSKAHNMTTAHKTEARFTPNRSYFR